MIHVSDSVHCCIYHYHSEFWGLAVRRYKCFASVAHLLVHWVHYLVQSRTLELPAIEDTLSNTMHLNVNIMVSLKQKVTSLLRILQGSWMRQVNDSF